jgi:hypothetical protein
LDNLDACVTSLPRFLATTDSFEKREKSWDTEGGSHYSKGPIEQQGPSNNRTQYMEYMHEAVITTNNVLRQTHPVDNLIEGSKLYHNQ